MNYKFSNLLGAPYRGGNLLLHDATLLLSPVGNRVSVVDLRSSSALTLPFEATSDISTLALSPNGVLLIAADAEGKAKLVNVKRKVVIHHFSFKAPVTDIKFSPDGNFFAAAVGRAVQIWRTPQLEKTFTPLRLVRSYKGTHDKVLVVNWSPDGRWIIAGCRDFTAKIFSLHALKGYKAVTLTGHREGVVGAFFKRKGEMGVYTVSKDGALFSWRFDPMHASKRGEGVGNEWQGAKKNKRKRGGGTEEEGDGKGAEEGEEAQTTEEESEVDTHPLDFSQVRNLNEGEWVLESKNFFMQSGAKLSACDFHPVTNLFVAGFSTGLFGIYQLPDFSTLQLLSVSREKISSVRFNGPGDWLAMGCAKLGQLLVWEWRAEAYVMKAQGHRHDVNSIAFSPDGCLLATGADDSKLKIWNTVSGFCFVTLSDHSMPITAVAFHPAGNFVLSASLDGTVRAFDLVRYRNFRTFTSPTPVQFAGLALHPSGDIVCASTQDDFQVYVWAVKTGRLLDVFGGHEGPVPCLAFSPTQEVLASGSWDGSVRMWDVFESKGSAEALHHNHHVLAIAYRPDGRQLAVSTLDGQIHFWDPLEGELQGVIEGRRDIAGGRRATDRQSAANSSTAGKCFRSLTYSADGSILLAAGTSRYICAYDVTGRVLLKRFLISSNRSLDGLTDMLNSKRMTDAGPQDLLDVEESDDDENNESGARARESLGGGMPGADVDNLRKAGKVRGVARVRCVRMAPTGHAFAAASSEGVLLFSLDEGALFDPNELDVDITPQGVEEALEKELFGRALQMAMRLNEPTLLRAALESVPAESIPLVVSTIPRRRLSSLLAVIGQHLENSPNLEFLLLFCKEILVQHGRYLASPQSMARHQLRPAMLAVMKSLTNLHNDLQQTCSSNSHLLRYLTSVKEPADRGAGQLVVADS